MSNVAFEKPVEDSVPKINDEVAVGEDLVFQRRWWKFESVMWSLIAILLLLNFLGVFGRGPAAHASLQNDALSIKYERVERFGTPAIFHVLFAPDVMSKGKVELFVSQSVVDELGAQRVIPAPLESAVGAGGITYTFAAGQAPGSVEFALQPARAGIYHFTVGIPGSAPLSGRIIVVP